MSQNNKDRGSEKPLNDSKDILEELLNEDRSSEEDHDCHAGPESGCVCGRDCTENTHDEDVDPDDYNDFATKWKW